MGLSTVPKNGYNRYMTTKHILGGVAHDMPIDLRSAIMAKPEALSAWQDITPLARNEWICWTVSVKTEATRQKHVDRAIEELAAGQRRPCCWVGCTHRTDKQPSRSQKFIVGK